MRFYLFIMLGLLAAGCSTSVNETQSKTVLSNSVFYSGEKAAGAARGANQDGGTIGDVITDQCEQQGEIPESDYFMDIVVSRVCTWHPEPIFFPDAVNPIVTLETFPGILDDGEPADRCQSTSHAAAPQHPIYSKTYVGNGDVMQSRDPKEAAGWYGLKGLAYFLYSDSSVCNKKVYRCWNSAGIHFETNDAACEGRGTLDGPQGFVCAVNSPNLLPLLRLKNAHGAYRSALAGPRLSELAQNGWSYDVTLGYAPNRPLDAESGIVLARKSMLGHDFKTGRYENYFYVDLAKLQQTYPQNWKQRPLRARICDDRGQSGSCNLADLYTTVSITDLYLNAEHLPPQINLEVFSEQFGYNPAYYHDLPRECDRLVSPLVLNLKGQPIQLTSADDGVMFDISGSGTPVATAWIAGAHDGLLARDLNHDGIIRNGTELFGSATRLKSGELAANGFKALADLDANGDGVLNSADSAWRELVVWRDANHNGFTERGELLTLAAAGITSFDLNYAEISEVDQFGNKTLQRSSFTQVREGIAQTAVIVDVWFKSFVNY